MLVNQHVIDCALCLLEADQSGQHAHVDDLDRRLIREARRRDPPRACSSCPGGSASPGGTVQARLDRLQASGIVSGFGPYVDLKALGYAVLAFTTLEIAQGQEGLVIDRLRTIAEVLEVHKVTGPGDLLCRVVARTNEHLHDVLEEVLATPGILRTTTVLALTSPVQRSGTDLA